MLLDWGLDLKDDGVKYTHILSTVLARVCTKNETEIKFRVRESTTSGWIWSTETEKLLEMMKEVSDADIVIPKNLEYKCSIITHQGVSLIGQRSSSKCHLMILSNKNVRTKIIDWTLAAF
jgi:hypothetical protein